MGTQCLTKMMRICIVLAIIFSSALTELSSLDYGQHKRDKSEDNLLEDLLSKKKMLIESCEIQKHLLSQLRSLVMSSIEQVKMCLLQEEQEKEQMKRFPTKTDSWKDDDEVKIEKLGNNGFNSNFGNKHF